MSFDPRKLSYDPHGVPYLPATEIESIASEVLTKHAPQVLEKLLPTPVVDIINALGATTGLQFVPSDLGMVGAAKVLGKVSFTRKTLYLDRSLIDGERQVQFRFTAAHEIGHWILHRWNYQSWTFRPNQSLDSDLADDDASLCRLGDVSPHDWLERQANIFAAALVMPTATFRAALIGVQTKLGIKRNLGKVWLSGDGSSQRDLLCTAIGLAEIYGVSVASTRVRLKTLQLVEDEHAHAARPASVVLPGALPGIHSQD